MNNIQQSYIIMQFEQIPNEILLEIFGYVKINDLQSFYGHNQRLNNVINEMKLNVIIENLTDDDDYTDRNYLKILLPKQFIRLELRSSWNRFDLNLFSELRSLSLNCVYLSEEQFEQLLTINLPCLERLYIDEIPYYYAKELFQTIIDSEHFPSLKICRFSGEYYYLLSENNHSQIINTTIRSLVLNRCFHSQFNQILTLLPNLYRLETSVNEPRFNLHMQHNSLQYLRITLEDSFNDLQIILPHISNLKQLRIRGKITETTVFEYFQLLKELLRTEVPNLEKFHCELYYHAWFEQVTIDIIHQLYPLFKNIQLHLGRDVNQCYTTDLDAYPHYSEYSHTPIQTMVTTFSNVMNGYDSDPYERYHDDDDYGNQSYNNGWIDYGLSYRGNYKANYGSSPWSGNNDD